MGHRNTVYALGGGIRYIENPFLWLLGLLLRLLILKLPKIEIEI